MCNKSRANRVLLPFFLFAVGGSAVADVGPVTNWDQATQASPQVVQQYWTPERMQQARPMPVPKVVPDPQALQSQEWESMLQSDAQPGLAPGWAPGSGPQPDPQLIIEIISEDPQGQGVMSMGGAEPQTSPPFSDPPTDPSESAKYAPFQRWTWYGRYLTFPTSTVGKLFFSQDDDGDGISSDFVCSASVIQLNTLATAGHCVNNGLDGAGVNGGFSTNVLFCPSFNKKDGINPARGCWAGSLQTTSSQWFSNSNFDRDYGCIVTDPNGGVNNTNIGNETGWLGRAFNWPTRQPIHAWGYPAGSPFPGFHIIVSTSTEWYEVNMGAGDGQVSKYIGNNMTGGSSGGPWWFNTRHPNNTNEYADTDASNTTDPLQDFFSTPVINGVNSHKRFTTGLLSEEMGSPPFLNTANDNNESEDVFAVCFDNGGT